MILMTGSAGFIGSHLVDRVLEEGYEVTVLDNPLTSIIYPSLPQFPPHISAGIFVVLI